MQELKTLLKDTVEQVLAEYGLVIGCLVIGILIGWFLKLFLTDWKYNRQVKKLIKEKNEKIAGLSLIISERLSKVIVTTDQYSTIKKIKKYFKDLSKGK